MLISLKQGNTWELPLTSHHKFGQTQLFRSIPHVKYQVRTCPLQQPQVGSDRLEPPSSEYGLMKIPKLLSGAAETAREVHQLLWVLSSGKENRVKNVIMLLWVYRASWTWCEVSVPLSKWVWQSGECCNRVTRLHREAVETPLLEVLKSQLEPNTEGDSLEQHSGLKDMEKTPATWIILWWKVRDSICVRTKELRLVSWTLAIWEILWF